MPDMKLSSYFYGDEAMQFTYFRIPCQLITHPRYKHLSTDSKLLYGMLLDRMSLSIKNEWYHICEFAERMEQIGAKYEPLDYIREPEFYARYFFAANENGPGPAYRIIDTRQEYGFAFAPKGAARGQKYCIFRQRADESGQPHVSCVVQWSDNLKDIAPQDWGFDLKKIKAVTQKPRKQTGHRR